MRIRPTHIAYRLTQGRGPPNIANRFGPGTKLAWNRFHKKLSFSIFIYRNLVLIGSEA